MTNWMAMPPNKRADNPEPPPPDPEEEFDGADLTIHKITATPDRETHW